MMDFGEMILERASIVKPFEEVKEEQMNTIKAVLGKGSVITKERSEQILLALMKVPEIMSVKLSFRDVANEKVELIFKAWTSAEAVNSKTRKLWFQYLEVLEDREDYVPAPPPLIEIPW